MLLDSAEILLLSIREKRHAEIIECLGKLDDLSLQEVYNELKSDQEKTVFWVNIYNALFQLMAAEFSEQLTLDRRTFFTEKRIPLFGMYFSFDQIEHTFLRKSKWKYSFGFWSNPFRSKIKRRLSVNKVDYRIHFLLNCGANSCPIIRPLSLANLEDTLENATQDYLEQEVFVDRERRLIQLNELFLFYLGDFGGKKGLRKILRNLGITDAESSRFKLKFTTFDKTPKLDYFAPNKSASLT